MSTVIHNAVDLVHFSRKKNGVFGQLQKNDTCNSSKGLAASGTEHMTELVLHPNLGSSIYLKDKAPRY